MAEYTSFTPWKDQIEALEPSVRSKSYRVSRSGQNVRLISADGNDEGMVAFINDRGTLGGGEDLVNTLKPILAGPTDEERAAPNLEVGRTTTTEPQPTAEIPRFNSGSLAAFATSGKGGLRNDRNETEAVEELQTFLGELGLDTGGIDGKYGPKTTQAVRTFQGSFNDIELDGDAGPETIGLIIDLRRDLARMQTLIDALNSTSVTDGIIPVSFKSSISMLLERDLTQQERTELEQLLNKYQGFIEEFPEYQTILFQQAQAASRGERWQQEPEPRDETPQTRSVEPVAPAGTTQAPNGPFLDGMVITPEINDRLQAVGRQAGAMGEPLDAEDIAALNRGVADGTITAPAEVSPEDTVAQTSAEWEVLQRYTQGYTIFIKRQTPPVFTYGLEGGAPVDREYNSLEDATAAARAAQEEEQAAAVQQPATTVEPAATPQPVEGNDFRQAVIENIQGWFSPPAPTPESTQNFLRLFELDRRTREELEYLSSIFNNNLVLKLSTQHLNYDIDGTRIRIEYRMPSSVTTVVENWITNDLRPALNRAPRSTATTSPTANTSEAEKAQALYDAMSGIGVNRTVVRETLLGITSSQEFTQVDAAFRQLSGGEGIIEFMKDQWMFSTVDIDSHLRGLGVAMESVKDIINLTKRLLER